MNGFIELVKARNDNELLTMVYQFTEWSPEMLRIVESELSSRKILPADLELKKQEAIELEDLELSNGQEASSAGIIFGFLSCLGLLGIIIGYNYAYSKARSKYTDQVYYKYNEDARTSGKYMLGIAIVAFILAFMYKVLSY